MISPILTGISLMIIGMVFICAAFPKTIEPTNKIRWKSFERKDKTIYKIQKQFCFFFWVDTIKLDDNGYPEDLYFENRIDAKHYVSHHELKKRCKKAH